MVNRVILVGNLGKDPEVKMLENGNKVAKFSLATSENYRDKSGAGDWQQKTEWHNIVAWGKLAERAESALSKGASIYLEGKLSTRKWQDKDGNDRSTTSVVASYFRIINKGGSSDKTNPYGHDLGNQEPKPYKVVDQPDDTEKDDLPF